MMSSGRKRHADNQELRKSKKVKDEGQSTGQCSKLRVKWSHLRLEIQFCDWKLQPSRIFATRENSSID
jgi:hypothetical protein